VAVNARLPSIADWCAICGKMLTPIKSAAPSCVWLEHELREREIAVTKTAGAALC
jgi:hypothetical protein